MKNFEDLKKRFLISIVIVLIAALIIIFSNLLFVGFIATIAVSVLASIAAMEFINIAKKKNIILHKNLIVGATIFLVISFFISSIYPDLKIFPVLIFILFLIFLFLNEFKQVNNSISRIASSIFAIIFIAIPLGMLLPILFVSSFEIQDGRYWILYIILVSKITDVGAYFGGRVFGKKKLLEKISPKKTIAGSISGLVLSVIVSIALSFLSKDGVFDITLIEAIFLGIILSVFAQFGDLSESLLKRDAKIKDSSAIPAIGGIFDMIDSLIFNIPIMYLFLIG